MEEAWFVHVLPDPQDDDYKKAHVTKEANLTEGRYRGSFPTEAEAQASADDFNWKERCQFFEDKAWRPDGPDSGWED